MSKLVSMINTNAVTPMVVSLTMNNSMTESHNGAVDTTFNYESCSLNSASVENEDFVNSSLCTTSYCL